MIAQVLSRHPDAVIGNGHKRRLDGYINSRLKVMAQVLPNEDCVERILNILTEQSIG
jgi:hypothetical protein